jgi:hypothetical protein
MNAMKATDEHHDDGLQQAAEDEGEHWALPVTDARSSAKRVPAANG